jgi:hypothetical protein
MNAARSYYAENSGIIKTGIYIVVAAVIVYYIYGWYSAPTTDIILLNSKVAANQTTTATISTGMLPAIRSGGSYTLSMWMYINSYDYRPGKPRSVFTITDGQFAPAPNSNAGGQYLAVGILYPNEPKMMIRFATTEARPDDYTKMDRYMSYMNSSYSTPRDSNPIELPSCDVMNIDLQRWINLTISVNGRVIDVYMDGKLTRSCVLSNLPIASQDKPQAITLGGPLGFSGYFGTTQFSGSALSPDKIYSLYQAGPYPGIDSGFLGFLANKIGIKLQYGGTTPPTATTSS